MTTVLKLKLNKLSTFWLFTILFIGNGVTEVLTAPAEGESVVTITMLFLLSKMLFHFYCNFSVENDKSFKIFP